MTYLREDTTEVPTGFPTLDRVTRGGLKPGWSVMLIARTEVGKTALAGQMAVNALTAGHPALFASLEQTRQEIVLRLLSSSTGLSMERVEQELLTDYEKYTKQLDGLFVTDPSKPSWDDLYKWVDTVKPKNTPIFVLDHLKLMKRGFAKGEAERVAMLAEDAKAFAKNAGCALLLIHQVARSEGDKKNHGHLPLTLESAMYGGEQDVDVMLGMYRPARDPQMDLVEKKNREREVYLQVLKNRHGPSHPDGIPIEWDLPSMRFREVGNEDPTQGVDHLG